MARLKKDNLITKRNVLNEIRPYDMQLQELRLFCIYLSKIHKDKPEETRLVKFLLEDFRVIMGIKHKNPLGIRAATNRLLGKVVNVPLESGGYEGFQLFKKCRVDIDPDTGEWFFEIDAHDDAIPLMFEFKNKYFSYKLSNALRLRSVNQIRFYEVLKQYEKIGTRILSVEELKDLLGIGKNEYPRFGDFKYRVLDPCQKALSEHTDIKFSYEPHGKKGKGGKVLSLKFVIEENKNFVDQLTLDMYIEQGKLNAESDEDEDGGEDSSTPRADAEDVIEGEYDINSRYRERIEFMREACNGEFSWTQIEELNNIMKENKSLNFHDELACHDYIYRRYMKMDLHDKQTKGTDKPVKSRFGLLRFYIRENIAV